MLTAFCSGRARALASRAALGMFVLLLATLMLRLGAVLHHWLGAVRYPFGLDYGEGIVWQQALLIPSSRMYGDIDHYPFIVFHYPPVYHLAVRAIASLGVDWLMAGRSLSLAAALAIGALAAAITYRAAQDGETRVASVIGAAVAGLITFSYGSVVVCAPLMRVDMLAVALSFLGVYCAIRSPERPWLLYAALGSCVLAVYCKQTAIAAPLAIVPVMFAVAPRRTMQAAGCGLALALAFLALLSWQTSGGFLRHILLYNINRYSLADAVLLILKQGNHGIYFILAGVAAAHIIRQRPLGARFAALRAWLVRSPAACSKPIVALYFTITTAMLLTLGKSGSAINYFIEPMCVWSVLIGLLTAHVLARRTTRPWPALGVAAALLLQLAVLPVSRGPSPAEPARAAELGELVERVRAASAPVLSDDMALLLRAGKTVPWEPAIFAELTATRRWNQGRILSMIRARRFAFAVTSGHRGDPLYDRRYTTEVSDAIEAAYPRREEQAGLVIHLPPG